MSPFRKKPTDFTAYFEHNSNAFVNIKGANVLTVKNPNKCF